MARTLKQHGWSWSVFPAVVGSGVTEESWRSVGVDILRDRGKLQHRPGAQGCWLSHFHLWSWCRESGGSMIIMEEDCLVLGPWDPYIESSSALIKLHENRGTKVNSITGLWGRGAFAYWLTAAHADRLICHAQQQGAQALDKHIGDLVVDWQHWPRPLVSLNTERGPSTTSPVVRR